MLHEAVTGGAGLLAQRPTPSDLGKFSNLAEQAGGILRSFTKTRQKHGLDFDDLAIILACGRINFGSKKYHFSYVQAANVSSIADYIAMPRETVRRRLHSLESKQLLIRVAHGYIINDLATWCSLVEDVK